MLPKAEFLTLCEVEVFSSACSLCPANSLSLPGSVAVGACVCNAGFTGPVAGVCSPCAAGTFNTHREEQFRALLLSDRPHIMSNAAD